MTPLVQNVTDLLSFVTVLSDIFAIGLIIILLTPLKHRGWGKKIRDFFGQNAVLFSFLVALGGVVGSLFYSLYAQFQPCLLCWIQRGFLYTQAVIFFLAMFARKEEHVRRFGNMVRNIALTLSTLGGLVALYHTYLQFGGSSFINCAATGVTCEFVYFVEFGYVTIPTMSLTAFALIILFMLCRKKNEGI